MRDYRLSEDREAVKAVATAIARVIARKTVAADGRLAKLDGLTRITATEELAQGMVGAVAEEAVQAVRTLESHLSIVAGRGAVVLNAQCLGDQAQSAFEDACAENPSPYEVGLAWRSVGKHLLELLVEAAEERSEVAAE